MSAVLDQVQFETVEAALRFAFRQDRENYQGSEMNRMGSSPSRGGMGLSGLDGAGMAGMIGRHVQALGSGPSAILRARYAQREVRCNCGRLCCKGFKTSEYWQETVAEVTRVIRGAVTGMSNYRYVYGATCKYFGMKNIRLGELAEACQIPQRTAEDHNYKIKQYIHKAEATAFHNISVALREAGIVGVAE